MSRYNDLARLIGQKTLFCNNLGFGEQGAILAEMPKSIFVCPDASYALNIKSQLDALGRENVLLDDFNKPFTLSKFQSRESKIDKLLSMFKLCKSNPIVVTTAEILFEQFPNIKNFENNILTLSKDKDYDLPNIESMLIKIGYKKVESVSEKGEFASRGDILDIFNIADEQPIRLDFFDTSLEKIYSFDSISFEKIKELSEIDICPNSFVKLSEKEKSVFHSIFDNFSNTNQNISDLILAVERDDDIPFEFVLPVCNNFNTITNFDIPIIISNPLLFDSIYSKIYSSICEKIDSFFIDEKLTNLYKSSKNILNINDFFEKCANNLIFFENFDINSTDFAKKHNFNNFENFDFCSVNFPSFLYNLEKLQIETNKYRDKQIYLCLASTDTYVAIKKIFSETNVNFSTNVNAKGIILTELKIPFNICFADQEKFYIGSSNFAHKKEFKQEKKQTVKYLPKAGEYVVHSVHGIGKCEGVTNVNVSGVEKEFFKIVYRGGDVLYVPFENADCLSLYLSDGSSNQPLNKLGGKEFATQKLKAIKSIEDMSQELLQLYAKRKSTKGFVYPEDDYLYTEFENAFEYNETADQLQAIADVKNDMQTGKVMDRLVCGDVGFGKTEVAMRAMFKAVEAGKQVVVLAPTTILSMQHCLSITKRMKDFGVKVEMLNRFKTTKEQKQIIEDLKNNKINIICGTHRLLSDDVKFFDLGLLVLDEEQRFGVKAKEHIKQIKNNIDVLSLSATPIPRTLSMTLMSIRDISIINTAPTNRLPVKTYVMCYDENVVANAINEELERDGQVLVVYNNIENIYSLANRLKEKILPTAKVDVAHGQMSEIALENAVKRLYDRETNVFVSTTLIENGIDLPKANTLIVVDSDKLGLSQMYQLRGRVGRNNDQAFAYFTYNKEKFITQDAMSRLQAIAENTELGSGFKIAMRDLQIRGAGELLGKTQHGHMLKIGYDMYTKLLNDTIKKLKGEKVEIEKEVKIDIAITSKIPTSFVDDETERLKIIAKISNINSKDSTRKVLNELLNEYGKLPQEIYHLANIAFIKSLAIKQNIKQIIINKAKMCVIYYPEADLQKIIKKVEKYSHFKFEKSGLPCISLNPSEFSVQTGMNYLIEFLNS